MAETGGQSKRKSGLVTTFFRFALEAAATGQRRSRTERQAAAEPQVCRVAGRERCEGPAGVPAGQKVRKCECRKVREGRR